MSEEKTAKELGELTYGFPFKQFVQIMLSSKILQDIYLEHFSDADQHSLDQMYINIKNIGGIDRPTGGQVRVDGFDLTELGESQIATFRLEKAGFIFQFYNLFPMLTAFENVEFPLVLAKKPRLEREKRVWELLDLVGMRNRAVHRPAELSGGEQQRVGIARALANNPSLVLADEPTGDLDSENANTFMQLVKQLNQTYGQTFLIVTHDPIVSQQCDTIYHIRDGRISKQV